MNADAPMKSAVFALSMPATRSIVRWIEEIGTVLRPLLASPQLCRVVVSLADVDPGSARWMRPGEAHDRPGYDAVVEVTVTSEAFTITVAAMVQALGTITDRLHAWRVTRLPAREKQSARGGIKYLVLCAFHDDLSPAAARRSWDHHVPLALRVHEGASRYVRSWFDEAMTPPTPKLQGMTELYFPTRADMEQRWFGSDDQRAQIVQDIGHFLRSGVRLYTSEHVLKE